MKGTFFWNGRLWKNIIFGVGLILSFSICNIGRAQLKADFVSDTAWGCEQLSVQFTNTSKGDPSGFLWDFGNGKTSNNMNPNMVFSTPGIYRVSLTVSRDLSKNTKVSYINVYSIPNVDYSISPPTGCPPRSVRFVDNSEAGSGAIISRVWDFGDGSAFGSGKETGHIYGSPGTYDVRLLVTNEAGCTATTSNDKITIAPALSPEFSADKIFSCVPPFLVQFTAEETGDPEGKYQWDFGDGSPLIMGRSVSHTYTTKGRFPVTLTVFADDGCQASIKKEDYIDIGSYSADFTYSRPCSQDELTFENTSSPLPQTATWDFGDGSTVNGTHVRHRFQEPGTYSVTLINDYGECTDTLVKQIAVFPSPSANFKSDKLHYCGTPSTATFQNLSEGGTSWKWDFGDDTGSSEYNPNHTYLSDGRYNISLIAISNEGCKDTMSKQAYIHIDAPDMSFSASSAEGCIPLPVTFSLPNSSIEAIRQFQWTFGDESPSSMETTPTHNYQTAGNFSVRLQVVTKAGCTFTMHKADFIHTGTIPVVDFDATPKEICLDGSIHLINHSVPRGDTWEWAFPDNGDSILTAENPSFKFNHVQDQDVKLTVGNNGCYRSVTKADFIKIRPPEADFSVKLLSCDEPGAFQFTDKSKSAKKWEWDFGDGHTANTADPNHTYERPGAYKVTLTAYNGSCASRKTRWLQVIDENIQLTVSTQRVCRGDTVTISASPFYSSQFEWTLTWYGGDGTSEMTQEIAEGVNVFKQVYRNRGTYTPSLKMHYVNGCYDSVFATPITVEGPVADFVTSAQEICQGNAVTFNAKTQTDPPSAGIQQWIWDFGDGTMDTAQTAVATHYYQTEGQFRTKLQVTDVNGCTDDTLVAEGQSIAVNPGQASFFAVDTILCSGKKVQWRNTSDADPGTTYKWDFGDGTTSDRIQPDNQSYLKDSRYTVSLIVNTNKGCTDTLVRSDYIRVSTPQAIIRDSRPVKKCRIYQDTAVSLSRNAASILWDFGDGTTSTSDTAYHIYNVPGRYVQRLIVTGYGDGCTDVTHREIIITGPQGDAYVSETAGCSPFTVQLSAKNIKGVSAYQWYFGDGAVSDVMHSADVSYTYDRKGLYHPALKLIDDTGCYVIVPFKDSIDIIVDSISVIPQYTWPLICDSNTIAFAPEGAIYSKETFNQPAKYRWTFGDANTATATSEEEKPQHRYRHPGIYNGMLEIRSAYGCISETPFEVTIPDSIPLKVSVAAQPTEICSGESVRLMSNSNIGTSYEWIAGESLAQKDRADVQARPEQTSRYEVVAFSSNRCQADTAAITITVHDLPKISAGPDINATTGSVIQLGATATGNAVMSNWEWTPIDYLSCTHCSTPVSRPRKNITYIVEGQDQFGCKGKDTVRLLLTCDEGKVFIPNTFTPNNDGVNDLFYPRGEGVKIVRYFRIYNRNGQLIYERTHFSLNDRSAAWDGSFKGRLLNPGVFVYSTSMICDNNKIFERSGDITLLR